MGCKRVDGTAVVITVTNVLAFCCDNLREGNIIFAAEVLRSDRVTRTQFERLCQATDDDTVNAYIAHLERQQPAYFELTSSYGAELIAACANGSSVSIE